MTTLDIVRLVLIAVAVVLAGVGGRLVATRLLTRRSDRKPDRAGDAQPPKANRPGLWLELRMALAERVFLFALRLVPIKHPRGLSLVKAIHDYAAGEVAGVRKEDPDLTRRAGLPPP